MSSVLRFLLWRCSSLVALFPFYGHLNASTSCNLELNWKESWAGLYYLFIWNFLILVEWVNYFYDVRTLLCVLFLVALRLLSSVVIFTCCLFSQTAWMWLAALPLFLVWITYCVSVVLVPALIFLLYISGWGFWWWCIDTPEPRVEQINFRKKWYQQMVNVNVRRKT